jgi:hypothetical protein
MQQGGGAQKRRFPRKNFALCTTAWAANLVVAGRKDGSTAAGARSGSRARVSFVHAAAPIHDPTLSQNVELPAALSAFLRGAERRAFVFLWLQSGDAQAAERALAAAIRAFPAPATGMPMADWPVRFWKLLVALPPSPTGHWPAGLDALPAMPLPVRRALLLRQVAGLDETAAAEVAELAVPAYQALIADACPRDPEGAPDVSGWRRQAEAIQQAGRELDPDQLQRLAQLREPALAGQAQAPAATRGPGREGSRAARARPGPRRQRRGWPLLAGAIVLVLLVAAAWTWGPWLHAPAPRPAAESKADVDDLRVHDNEPVLVEPLPPADPPAVAATGWPDALPEPAPDPLLADLALLSWYAAGAPQSHLEREEAPATEGAPPPPPMDAGADPIDGDAWQQFGAFEQAQVRAAAAALQALDPAAQAQLRTRFAALDALERRGWLLGPSLGADYIALQPLFGFVPEAERAPLLAVLRALDPGQRRRLADLAQRTPPAERDALRRALLAAPPAERGAWLEQRGRQ